MLLEERDLERRLVGTVPTVTAALLVVRSTDLVGFAAERLHRDIVVALGLVTFAIPLELPPLRLSLAYHPRYDADAAHAWLRARIRDALTAISG